jgi:hypothetical protein
VFIKTKGVYTSKDKSDVIFCMNQLGGVGGVRGSRMFLPSADGVKDCFPGPYVKK